MVVESVVSSFIVGKIRKGKIINIGNTELNGWYLFIISAFIEISANLFVAYSKSYFADIINQNFIYIHFICYFIIFIGIYKNKEKKSLWIIFTGTFLNFLCIMANNGHMPISLNALKFAGLVSQDASNASLDLTHTLLNVSSKLTFLSDIFAFPKQYPRAKVFSVGDVLIAVGVFMLLQGAMKVENKDIDAKS